MSKMLSRLVRRPLSKPCLRRTLYNSTYYETGTSEKAPVFDDPQIGDYPNLPYENHQTRAASGYWDKQGRVNFGEPVLLQANC